MKRTVRGTVIALFGASLAAAMAPACVDYPQSIVVTAVVPLKASTGGGGGCIAEAQQPDEESLGLIEGLVDVSVSQSYVASLNVVNNLRPSENAAKARTEANSVYLLGATVRLAFPSGEPVNSDGLKDGRGGNEFRTEGSGFVTPGGASTLSVNLLDSAAICQISRTVNERVKAGNLRPQEQAVSLIAFAKVQAQTLGGLSIESQEFQFPVKVCWGCLVTSLTNGTCPPPPATTGAGNEGPCRVGQDELVRCDLCQASSEFCATGTLKVLPSSCRE